MYIRFCISKNVKKYTFYPFEINNLTTVLQLIIQVVRLIMYLHTHCLFLSACLEMGMVEWNVYVLHKHKNKLHTNHYLNWWHHISNIWYSQADMEKRWHINSAILALGF